MNSIGSLPGRRADPGVFGSAINNFGVRKSSTLVDWAPPPSRATPACAWWTPSEEKFSGFVFKIQANMDPKHRDRICFYARVPPF